MLRFFAVNFSSYVNCGLCMGRHSYLRWRLQFSCLVFFYFYEAAYLFVEIFFNSHLTQQDLFSVLYILLKKLQNTMLIWTKITFK